MPPNAEPSAGSLPATRAQAAELVRGAKLLSAWVDKLLNFLFSFVVLIAATLSAAWLQGHLGDYPPSHFADACVMLVWLAAGFTLAGCYIHVGLLRRSWMQLCGVSAIAVIALWRVHGAIVCWVPLFVLVGGALAEVAVRPIVNQSVQRIPIQQRLPRPLSWLVSGGKFVVGVGLPLMVIYLIVFAMSGLARNEFVGQTTPDVVFETADGTPWRLADQRGKVVLLDFWAPWCGPCRAAMREIKALHEKYADRSDFLLVGASEENDRQWVAKFCREQGLAWLQVFLPDRPLTDGVHPDDLTRPGIPSAWIIDRDGIVVGADLRGAAVGETIERAMNLP